MPRDHWLTEDEKQAILDYEQEHPREGYRRLTFMMLDDEIAAATPATLYHVLKKAERLGPAPPPNERKGKGSLPSCVSPFFYAGSSGMVQNGDIHDVVPTVLTGLPSFDLATRT